ITITSPDPYQINSTTVIATDPTITTNGVTDFGKIYRGPTDDGPFSQYAFGSTSAFDTALKLDTEFFADPAHLPIAAFKFQSLLITGDPIVDTTGGPSHLALIAVDGINTEGPGGPLTFGGIDQLFLATVNGSINLTSNVSFSGFSILAIYARGATSDLTINSPINSIDSLKLAAERSLQLTNSGSMSLGSFDATTHSGDLTLQLGSLTLNGELHLDALTLGESIGNGANITVNLTGNFTNNSATDSSQLSIDNFGGQIGTGGNISVDIGGNLTTNGTGGDAGKFDLTIQNTNGQITNGGNITLVTGGSISTGGAFNLLVENYDETANPAGHIGTGGNITLSTGGNLTADFASIATNNRGGGQIDSSVDLSVNISGALTTLSQGTDFLGNPSSFTIDLASRYDDTMGNTAKSSIGGNATVDFHADSISIGGSFNAVLSDRGGTIGGNALLNFDTTHDITVSGPDITDFDAATFQLLNDGGTGAGSAQSPFGGTIHGDATLQVGAANLAVPSGSLDVFLQNRNGGVIDGNATINFNLTGNLTVGQFASFFLTNHQNFSSNGLPGGSIGSAAMLDISAANVSVGADFGAQIFNGVNNGAPGPAGGSIGTNATLNVTANNFTITGGSDVEISNYNAATSGGSGGTIGGNATVNFDAAGAVNTGTGTIAYFLIQNQNLSDGGLGGTIGGNAAINLSAASMTSGSTFVRIDNSNGGTIDGSAMLSMSIGGDVTSNPLTVDILNPSGGIGGPATIDFSAGGNVNVTGALFSDIYNPSGVIGGNAVSNFSAANVTATGDLVFGITSDGGTIVGNAAATLTAGNLDSSAGNFFLNVSNNSGSIANDATINLTAASLSAGLQETVIVNNAGTIGGKATINDQISGDVVATGDTFFDLQNNDEGNGAGQIGSDATISLAAANVSTTGNFNEILNNGSGGLINGAASVTLNLSGDLTVGSGAFIQIDNFNGSIGGDASIAVNAANISASSLSTTIDNTNNFSAAPASVAGNATIDMNVSGDANVTNDATVAIYGSDAASSAAINVNGGTYSAGGTFLTYIDGDGTITFNNVMAHADVLKVGALGTNGVLNIGGGNLSADSELKLYASGSNGQINFVANVTLGGLASKILAANSITILDNVVVTISGGESPVQVYTNNANYSESSGGNGSTTGEFAGNGASPPQPLASAPPFNPAARTTKKVAAPTIRKAGAPSINVTNTDQVLSLLDSAAPGPGGKTAVAGPGRAGVPAKAPFLNPPVSRLQADRRADVRNTSGLVTRAP
ncbi:MAG: beta strand repeat-containing protein, partial [Chthoniobacterales bacterium]